MLVLKSVAKVFLLLAGLLIAGCKDEESQVKKAVTLDPSSPDIVLIGSEIEGIYLADAAREEGLSVVILDPRERPGGQLIQGQMLYLDEPQSDNGKSLLQGKVKGLFDAYKGGTIRKLPEFKAYYSKLIEGIPLESGITITGLNFGSDPNTSKKRINSLNYRTKDGREKSITAKYWVENTDFAAMTSRLGLSRIPGVELVFGGTKDYMASSLMMKFKNVDWQTFQKEINRLGRKEIEDKYGVGSTVTNMFTWGFSGVGSRYKPTNTEVFLRGLNTVNQLDGEALINALLIYNVDPANPESVRKAIELGRRETDLVLQHLRKELPGWEKAELNGYPDYLYVRDYDRYETEYVLEAADLMSGRTFWDNVSIAGYPLDLQGTQNSVWGSAKGDPDLYGMPLRSFIPKGYANVIVVSKNVGATGPAYGSARIQPNTSLAGEVIGYLLGYIEGKHELAELTEKQMTDFHKTLSKKGIAVSGIQGNNKIKHLTPEQLEKFNRGSFVVK